VLLLEKLMYQLKNFLVNEKLIRYFFSLPNLSIIDFSLRKLSLDELPNLINIFTSEMGFVGPRPALYNQDELMQLRINVGVDKLLPGLTGWAQINGRDELSLEDKVAFPASL